MKKYTITALVANKSGVLTRISGLFARRAFNIESLCGCTTENQALSRMTIVLSGDEYTLAQLTKQLDKLPQAERIRDKGYEILYLTDDVDEFAVKLMDSYDDKKFKSVSDNDLDLSTDEEKKDIEEKTAEDQRVDHSENR